MEMLTNEKQARLLNALSNDLSLLKYTKGGAFPLTVQDFRGENVEWYKVLLEARTLGYDSINNETIHNSFPKLNADIKDVKSPKTDVLNIVNQLIDYKATVQFKRTIKEIADLSKKMTEFTSRDEYNQISGEIATLAAGLKKTTSGWNSRSALDILNDDFHYEEDSGRIPTFLSELDEVLGLGLYRAGIHVISAFPHNGKTTSAVQFATMQACHDYKVLYISLEQNAIDILENVLSVLANSSKHNRSYWEVGKLESIEDAKEKVAKAKALIKEYTMDFLHIDDTNFDGIDSIMERIRFACEEENFDIIYIDNFQNISTKGEKAQEFERFADELLAASKGSKTPIVCLSQLTQDAKGNKKTKWAAKLNENAVTNLEIYREKPDEDAGVDADFINIAILKNRKGKGFLKEDLQFPFLADQSIIGSVNRPVWTEEQKNKRNSEFGSRMLVG